MSALGSVDGVLFDLDGVLIDSERVWFHLMNAAARHFGVPPISAATFRAGWGQGMEADQETYFRQRSIEEVAAYYDAHYEEYLEHLAVAPELPRVFEGLAARGLPSAVVTNTPNPLAGRVVTRAGAPVRTVVGGNDVPHPKPAPDMVVLACERLGVAPARALVVGDSRYDREAARGAGVAFAGLGIGGGAVELGTLGELLDHL